MSHFQGRKCDYCGVEKREDYPEPGEPRNMTLAQTPATYERPWMEIHWEHVNHLCPNCAEVANKAMGFARDIRR